MLDLQPKMFVDEGKSAPRPGLPFVERDAITALVRNPKTGKYLCLRWKEVDWETFVTGGIESGQSAKEAARAEVLEETGYKNLRFIQALPRHHSKFYHPPKRENRFAHVESFLFELWNDERDPVSPEEKAKHEIVWLTETELKTFRLPEPHRFLINYIFEQAI